MGIKRQGWSATNVAKLTEVTHGEGVSLSLFPEHGLEVHALLLCHAEVEVLERTRLVGALAQLLQRRVTLSERRVALVQRRIALVQCSMHIAI